MIKKLLYLLPCLIALCAQNAVFGASTSADAAKCTSVIEINRYLLDNTLTEDTLAKETEIFPRTLKLLQDHGVDPIGEPQKVFIVAPVLENPYCDVITYPYKVTLFRHLFRENKQAGYALAKVLQHSIKHDSGYTLLHEYAEAWIMDSLSVKRNVDSIDFALIDLLKPILNTPNNNGVTPIFLTAKPEQAIAMHFYGARIDVETVQAARMWICNNIEACSESIDLCRPRLIPVPVLAAIQLLSQDKMVAESLVTEGLAAEERYGFTHGAAKLFSTELKALEITSPALKDEIRKFMLSKPLTDEEIKCIFSRQMPKRTLRSSKPSASPVEEKSTVPYAGLQVTYYPGTPGEMVVFPE